MRGSFPNFAGGTRQSAVMTMRPRDITIKDYDYPLPEERIAAYPLARRDESRLLVYRNGDIREDIHRNIAEYIPSNALLLFNDTRVLEARIHFQKPTGGTIEIFCLEPATERQEMRKALQQKESVRWLCLIGGASKWKRGQILEKRLATPSGPLILRARFVEKKVDDFIIELSWTPPNLTFAEVLHHAGTVPLPPYLRRKAGPDDSLRYQTVFAAREGSVAAPTAGLHFTKETLDAIHARGIRTEWVTLHVGAGTFMPVKSRTLADHLMHAESMEISLGAVESLLAAIRDPIIPVGTTSLRTLESLYWMGVKAMLDPDIDAGQIGIGQWEAYDMAGGNVPPETALQHLRHWMVSHQVDPLVGNTRLLIAPGYRIRMASAILTNFHQPESTLLLLVASMIGEEWRKVYQYALDEGFRFLSYGDSSLLFRPGA